VGLAIALAAGTATMKDVSKMSDREMRGEIRSLRGLLAQATCPNTDCTDGGIPVQVGDDEWEAMQCQWCHERSELIANRD
jgi:hypothetical protein